jgi:hypothetical protein
VPGPDRGPWRPCRVGRCQVGPGSGRGQRLPWCGTRGRRPCGVGGTGAVGPLDWRCSSPLRGTNRSPTTQTSAHRFWPADTGVASPTTSATVPSGCWRFRCSTRSPPRACDRRCWPPTPATATPAGSAPRWTSAGSATSCRSKATLWHTCLTLSPSHAPGLGGDGHPPAPTPLPQHRGQPRPPHPQRRPRHCGPDHVARRLQGFDALPVSVPGRECPSGPVRSLPGRGSRRLGRLAAVLVPVRRLSR